MKIRCKKSKHFLCEIDMKDYFKNLDKLGISQQVPLRLVIPCQRCKKMEIYKIFENHYIFEKNVDKN